MPTKKAQQHSTDLAHLIESINLAHIRARHERLTSDEVAARGLRSLDLGFARLHWDGAGDQRVVETSLLALDEPVTREQLTDLVGTAAADSATVRVHLPDSGWSREIAAWLAELGFHRRLKSVHWIRRTDNAPNPPCAYHIREMQPGEEEAFREIVGANYPKGVVPRLIREMPEPGKVCVLAFDGETPVATGMIGGHGDSCGFGYGTTMRPYRKQGIQQAMIAARLRAAAERGWIWATASTWGHDRSSRNLARQGFVTACEVGVWERKE